MTTLRNARITRKRPAAAKAAAAVSVDSTSQIVGDPGDYLCPVCFDIMKEVHMTRCGHSFCHKCIRQCLEQRKFCPKCNAPTDFKQDVFPNFKLEELTERYRHEKEQTKRKCRGGLGAVTGLTPQATSLLLDKDHLDLTNVDALLDALKQRKAQLEGESSFIQNEILHDFLVKSKLKKEQEKIELDQQLEIVNTDLAHITQQMKEASSPTPTQSNQDVATTSDQPETFNGNHAPAPALTILAKSKARIQEHFDDLEQCYFTTRQRMITEEDSLEALSDFREGLLHFSRFSSLRTLATLRYASDFYSSSSIVSSIEFDRDCDFFALGGVTKKIKIYDYLSVTQDHVGVHHPVVDMLCSSKISSVAWSHYHRSTLASSDYEGTVTVWDVSTASKAQIYQEHEKRCWCVDFNCVDPKLLASGSDDTKVKLWHTNVSNSIMNIDAKANVCCVKFKPDSRYHLAFGSADHCVHYYDVRMPKVALSVMRGHQKAVSYTKFLSNHEIISASTDSQLKLWDLSSSECVRTFKGHINEKNFVGLATDGKYIACGSENNSLYLYYKGLSRNLLSHKFDPFTTAEKERRDEENGEFVSAVTWKPNSNVIAVANSQGVVKLLELV